MRTCRDCGREKPEPVVPAEASQELKLCLVFAANVCRWCADVNLLGGGWAADGLEERWSAEELAELHAEAQKLMDQRLRLERIRKLRNRLDATAKKRVVAPEASQAVLI